MTGKKTETARWQLGRRWKRQGNGIEEDRKEMVIRGKSYKDGDKEYEDGKGHGDEREVNTKGKVMIEEDGKGTVMISETENGEIVKENRKK